MNQISLNLKTLIAIRNMHNCNVRIPVESYAKQLLMIGKSFFSDCLFVQYTRELV